MKEHAAEFGILKRLIVDWPAAIADGATAKKVILSRTSFKSEEVRECVHALLMNGGDVHKAVRDLSVHPPPWLKKFVQWCDKIRGGAK